MPHIRHATHVPGGLYNTSFVFIMNPRKWSKLSKPDQDAITALSGEAHARRAGKAWDAADAQADAAMREAKIKIVIADPAFVAEVRAKTAGLEKAWIDRARAKGIDGDATLKSFREEIAALSKQ
jgi:TRAP-type C4-dicarboxylate transport system substrate-binding protein